MNLSRIADKSRPDYLARRLKALEDEVARLRTARTLNAAEIGAGGGIYLPGGIPAITGTDGINGAAVTAASIPEAALGFTLPGGTKVTIATGAPSSPAVGDLWLDASSGYLLKEWDGSAWQPKQFGTGAVSFDARALGGVVATFAAAAPSSPLVGDLWYDTANGNRLAQWDGTTWTNALVGTAALADASITAGKVSFTARDIGGLNVSFAASAPASPLTGDLWYDTTNGYKLNEWDGTAWQPKQYGTNAIAAGAVTAALIAAHTITAAQIAAGTITATEIAANTITAAQIAATTITAAQIAANTITAAQIAAGTITATQLAADSVTATQIAAGAVTASELAAGAVVAGKIAAGSITATELAANSVTASQIAANAVTAAKIAAGTVVAGIIDGTTVTGAHFVVTASGDQLLVYEGSPGLRQLAGSISGGTATDVYGNNSAPGFNVYTSDLSSGGYNIWQWGNSTAPNAILKASGTGATLQSVATHESNVVVDGAAVTLQSGDDGVGKITLDASLGGGVSIKGNCDLVPSGSLIMYGGATAPTGWLKCDGTAVSRTTYAALFAVVGTSYGAGDGSTTFNLPNLGSAFPRGNTPGSNGGAATHHHPLSDAGQAEIQTPGNTIGVRRVAVSPNYTTNREMTGSSSTAGGSSYGFGAALTGNTDDASTLPPYVGVTFIIKT